MSNNTTTLIIHDLDYLIETYYQRIGSTWVVDSLFVFLMLPFGTISCCLNILSLVAFFKIKNQLNKSKLTNYFKIYTLSSFFASFILTFYFITAPRYFDFVNSYWIGVFCCKIAQYVLTLYFFNNILDIFILFERCTHFVDRLKPYSRFNPYVVCLITFIVCNVINFPYMFAFSAQQEDVLNEAMVDPDLPQNFTYCKREFTTSYGRIILMAVAFLRDFVTLFLELAASIISIVLFRRFLFKRKLVIQNQNQAMIHNLNNQTENMPDALSRAEKFNLKLTKMTVYLSICSIILHMTIALSYIAVVVISSDSGILSNSVTVFCCMAIHIKYMSNFIFFFYFNQHFRDFFTAIFCRQGSCFNFKISF